MKKILLIGKIASGKTSLSQRIMGLKLQDHKTQAIEVINDDIIDTPGEYVELKQYYRALVTTAAEVDCVLVLQDCTDTQCSFSPRMKCMFNRPMIGVLTKIDLAPPLEQLETMKEILQLAGAEEIFCISSKTGEGIEELLKFLQ